MIKCEDCGKRLWIHPRKYKIGYLLYLCKKCYKEWKKRQEERDLEDSEEYTTYPDIEGDDNQENFGLFFGDQ